MIIYTYPKLTTITGTELLICSDVDNSNATRSMTTAAFGAYIQATYGPSGNIYQADGSLVSNRTLSGDANYLHFDNLSNFTVNSNSSINLNPLGGVHAASQVIIGDNSYITVDNPSGGLDVIVSRSNPTTKVRFSSTGGLPGTPDEISLEGTVNAFLTAHDPAGVVGIICGATTAAFGNNITLSPTTNLNLDIGANLNGDVLTSDGSGNATWQTPSGGGDGIYGGSGSLIIDTIVTSDNFDLSINEVSTVRPSIFNVVKGTIPPVKIQDRVAEFIWNGAASGATNATTVNITNVVDSGASELTALNVVSSGSFVGPKTGMKSNVIAPTPSLVGADVAISAGVSNNALVPCEPTTYGLYSFVKNTQATTVVAGYFAADPLGGVDNYAIVTNGGSSGFGTTAPNPAAIVDIRSDSQGLLIPRWTAAEQIANTAAWAGGEEGMTWFNSTTKQFMGWSGAASVILG